MPGNLFTAVTIRRRSAAHVCANAHPDARSARDGRDDQVDIGFGKIRRFTTWGSDALINVTGVLFHQSAEKRGAGLRWISNVIHVIQ